MSLRQSEPLRACWLNIDVEIDGGIGEVAAGESGKMSVERREGGREGGRKGGREGGWEGGRKGGREREGGREGMRERGREGRTGEGKGGEGERKKVVIRLLLLDRIHTCIIIVRYTQAHLLVMYRSVLDDALSQDNVTLVPTATSLDTPS